MNTFGVAITLAVMVAMASALGYNSYGSYPSSFSNSWNSWGSRGGRLGGGWNSGLHRGLRHKRAAVGYGSFDPYYGNNLGGHIGSGFLNRRLGGLGSGRRLNSRWNQFGY